MKLQGQNNLSDPPSGGHLDAQVKMIVGVVAWMIQRRDSPSVATTQQSPWTLAKRRQHKNEPR
jgi:hypothetical protein